MLEIWSFLREARINEKREFDGAGLAEGLPLAQIERLTPTADALLNAFDTGQPWDIHLRDGDTERSIRPSDVLEGLRAAFNDSGADLEAAIRGHYAPFQPGQLWHGSQWPERYKERTGRNLMVDLGGQAKAAKAILRRGAIQDEQEWRLLKNMAETGVLSERQRDKAYALLEEFEFNEIP